MTREYLTWQDLPTTVTANGVICSTAQIENDFREQRKENRALKTLINIYMKHVTSIIRQLSGACYSMRELQATIEEIKKSQIEIHYYLNK